ncbi:MAG: CotH kinase family protein [Fibrobacter sp.]|nr:CotH kinase family protein [Fibrobacter sp.]
MRFVKNILCLISLVSVLLLLACSEDANSITNDDSGSPSADLDDINSSDSNVDVGGVATLEDLPNCTTKRVGEKHHVNDDNTLYVCQDKKWISWGEYFAAEEDLMNCTASRTGLVVYVKEIDKRLECKGKRWVDYVLSGSSSSVADGVKKLVIDPVTGDTSYVDDTTAVYKDTTLRWLGNSDLLITEISPLNMNWKDLDGDDGAWVEIFNAGEESTNLKGYSLVESLKDPKKWTFGDESIAAQSYRIVFLDKKDVRDVSSLTNKLDDEGNTLHARTHTNWKLDKSGGTLYLIDPSNGILDSVQYPEINTAGVSWGVDDDETWKYFAKSTPEGKNSKSEAYEGFSDNPDFGEIKAGFYTGSVTINPPSTAGGAIVRCTKDGSAPTSSSTQFVEPLVISKNTVLRCATFENGKLPSKVITKTFFVGETVKMPVVAVSVSPVFFTSNYIRTSADKPEYAPSGLYADVEYPGHVEYFENGSSSNGPAFEIDAGISLMGNYSRLSDKKSVAIVMREEYQDGWLHYPLFETRKGVNDKYKAFNLRNNGNRFVSDYLEDAMGGAILEGSGVDYQRSRQVVVFYNGTYYGIHDMRERYNKNYVETNYGIDANSVNFIKHLGTSVTASNGTVDNYKSMLKYVATHNMSDETNYATAKTMLDIGNYADYMIAEMYMHNGDWPNNNVRAWRSPDQPWKFMVYDLDHGFDWDWEVSGFYPRADGTNMFEWVKQGGTSGSCTNNTSGDCFHTLFVRFLQSPNFQRLFINHAAVMTQNYVNSTRVSEVLSQMASTLEASETNRDLNYYSRNMSYENTCGGGFSIDGSCMKTWAKQRDGAFFNEIVEEFGLSGYQITITIASNGKGKVLMEGMNLPGSTASYTNYKGTFFGGVPMELTAVPAAGAMFMGWSDGNPDNPRLVSPEGGETYTALFE